MTKKEDGFAVTKTEISKLTGGKRERAERLLGKAEFMDIELRRLQDILKEKGWVEEYQNGANQCGFKKSTEGDVYNTMIKNYTSTMKQLEEMLSKVPGEEDELDEFFK